MWCKGCIAQRSKRYYAAHREEKLAKMAAKREAAAPGPKLCRRCGLRETITRRHNYCRDCHLQYPSHKRSRHRSGSTNRHSPERAAKYGPMHRARRASAKRIVDAGNAICPRCGDPILPGELWDLGHVDGTVHEYQGAEHRGCNRATSKKRIQSRRW